MFTDVIIYVSLFYFILFFDTYTFIILYICTSCYGARHMPGKIATLALGASVEIAPQLKQKRISVLSQSGGCLRF